jgi:hypothetical protein
MDLRGAYGPAYGGVENTPPSAGPSAPPKAGFQFQIRGRFFWWEKTIYLKLKPYFKGNL